MNEKTYQSAYELHELIVNDERYIALNRLEKEMEEDDEVCALSYKKDLANDKYNDMVRLFGSDSKEASKALKELYEAKKNLDTHPKVVAYINAFKVIRHLFDEINEILFKDISEDLCPKKEK